MNRVTWRDQLVVDPDHPQGDVVAQIIEQCRWEEHWRRLAAYRARGAAYVATHPQDGRLLTQAWGRQAI